MRTTLKRGIGRGAAANGNGRAVLPPGVLTPITRYRQPPPPSRSGLYLVGRIVLWLFVLVLMLAVAFVGGYYLFLHEGVAAVRAHSRDVKIAEKALDVPIPGRAAVALVVGYDHRVGQESAIPSRSDTIMLLRADPQTNTISMLSFPRDLVVPVRCPGKTPFSGRINSAYAECGSRGTLDTVKSLTGIPINYLITVNFHGFKQIVDRLGGVWIDVDRRYFNDNGGRTYNTYAAINLPPGYQKLNGSNALDFVRYRHTDSDLYRLARQQLFVRALKEQITHSFVPLSIPRIVGAITKNVEVGAGGGKALNVDQVVGYGLFAYRLPAGHLFQAKLGGLTGYNELYTAPENVQAAIQQFMNPDVGAPQKATDVALGTKSRARRAPPPRTVSVTPLNGNGVPGSATNAGYLLHQHGYPIIVPPNGKPANAPTWNYFHTKVYFDRAQAGSRVAAAQVAKLFGGADTEPMPADISPLSNGAMLVVVVGQTFHGTLAPAPVDQTPTRQPPNIAKNPAASLPLLRKIRRRVPFRLEVPTILERSSVPDVEMPIRVYRVARHKAVRLVFRTGATEYWGVEETDWADAPILSGPNFQRRLAGRTYDLYYSGPHLHMVVLRQGKATYWVVNTLLDALSNETMLAVAKGLRPLARH